MHIPSVVEESLLDPRMFDDLKGLDPDDVDNLLLFGEPWDMPTVPPEWEGVPLDFYDDTKGDDENDQAGDASVGQARHESEGKSEGKSEGDERPEDEEGASLYLWGQQASGFSFSPGADPPAVWYDKALEERLSGKLWMRPIHEAGG